MSTPFEGFAKMARLSRECVITEKIDGTNAQIFIEDLTGDNFREEPEHLHAYGPNEWNPPGICVITKDFIYGVSAGSRTRWVTPQDDNYNWAQWVYSHAQELVAGLGPGRHYGEWWGSGINRGYDLPKGERRFSLFNTKRWKDDRLGNVEAYWKNEERTQVPDCCSVVPILASGIFDSKMVNHALDGLKDEGSFASRGFMRPEGIVLYHVAGGVYFKKTIEKDEEPKSRYGRGN